MTHYGNTLTLHLGRRRICGAPRGQMATAWDRLRAEFPALDGARIADWGTLHVQVERTLGTAAERSALVYAAAEHFGASFGNCPVQTDPMTWGEGAGHVTWTQFQFEGQNVCVETSICDCHQDPS